jgi:hypothetical protein
MLPQLGPHGLLAAEPCICLLGHVAAPKDSAGVLVAAGCSQPRWVECAENNDYMTRREPPWHVPASSLQAALAMLGSMHKQYVHGAPSPPRHVPAGGFDPPAFVRTRAPFCSVERDFCFLERLFCFCNRGVGGGHRAAGGDDMWPTWFGGRHNCDGVRVDLRCGPRHQRPAPHLGAALVDEILMRYAVRLSAAVAQLPLLASRHVAMDCASGVYGL